MSPPAGLVLDDLGSFFVGGRHVAVRGRPVERIYFTAEIPDFPYDPNGDFVVEQAYVQYFVPARRVTEVPVLFQHGGALSGAMWETTPDGRPGWVRLFLEAGFPVYVIDNVERGRAGWCALDGEWPGRALMRSAQEAWSLFRIGSDGGFGRRTPFPGQRFPVERFDELLRTFVPRWASTVALQTEALAEAVRRIGRCVIVCHSQGGELGQRCAVAMPEAVPACVAIEPSGFPATLADVDVAGRGFLYLMGDYLEATPLWQRLTRRTAATAAALAGLGARASFLALPEAGIRGNSHMPMMDDNSAEIAALVQDWILAQLGAPPR